MGKKRQYRVLGINTNLETDKHLWFEEYDFNAGISFSDYDAVIIDTGDLLGNYRESGDSPYLNKRLLTVNESHRIVDDFRKIKEQIIEYLKQGKTIFVILGNNDDCYIFKSDWELGNKEILNTNSFLPVMIDIQYLTGEKYERCDNRIYNAFFYKTSETIFYSAQFNVKGAIPLLKIPNSDKMISAELPFEKGRIVFLPDNNVDYEDEGNFEKYKKLYLDELYKLIDQLYHSDADFSLPEWSNSFTIFDEKKQLDKLNSDIQKLERLQKKIANEQAKLEAIQQYKALLTETGLVLESIVKKVLSELGFELQKTEIGRSDIIAKYADTYIVAEIKGVVKSATERHANQLEKWVSIFRDDNESKPNPKPLLIVNGFKDIPVFERTEDVFPAQMHKFSVARDHALVSTTQLLCLYIDIKTNPDKKDTLIKELLSTIGVYNRYTNISDYLQPIEKDED